MNRKKIVLGIGGFTHEGFTATIKSLGYEYFPLKFEDVSSKTWLKRLTIIHDLKRTECLVATIIYLHTTLLLKASKSEFYPIFLKILETIHGSKTIIFVYQDNLDGIFALRHWDTKEPMTVDQLDIQLDLELEKIDIIDDWHYKKLEIALGRLKDYESRTQEINDFIMALYNHGAEVAPYFVRSDVTIRLQEFLSEIEQGVFLRLFVSNDRLQAEQLRGLLSVLERYLKQVEGIDFSIDVRKSEKGAVYMFKSDGRLSDLQSFNDAFGRFDSFMKLCGDDPSKAESILKSKGLTSQESSFLVEKYSKDFGRLILDSRHELERKTLILRQKLESEIVEGSSLPTFSLSTESLAGLVSVAATGSNISINIGTVSVVHANKIQTEIDQIINGSVSYNDNDKLLLDLFSRYADGLEALQCRSDLDQLKDHTSPEPVRQNAKQRLNGFLRKAVRKVGETAEKIAVETLSKYLESLIKHGS